MAKDVIIHIEGIVKGMEEDSILTKAVGTHSILKETHYIQYEEEVPEEDSISKNRIKIGASRIELTKKGKSSSRMVFDLKEKTEAIYETGYGSMCFDIGTKAIRLEEGPERLRVQLEYTLFTNDTPISDHRITITVDSVLPKE